MVNDPKDDKDLKNKENSVPDEASEDGRADNEDVAEGAESEETSAHGDAGPVAEDATEDGIEDAVLVEDADSADSVAEDSAPVTEVASARTTQPASSGGSTFAMIAGGLIAGGIGFLVATFAVPEGWPNGSASQESELADRLALTSDELAAQSGRLDALQAELEKATQPAATEIDLGSLNEAVSTLDADLAALSQRLDGLVETLDGLDARMSTLEDRPAVVVPDGSDAMAAQIQAFQSELDAVTEAARSEITAAREAASQQIAAAQAEMAAVEERAEQLEAEAEEAARVARQQAAISAVRAALDSGAPFADDLELLTDAPEALLSVAKDGVPTLASLQAGFPAAARAALSHAEASPEEASAGDRFAAFLKRQTNARSLAPREGDDVDAILSRAEAAVAAGDLGAAISEIEMLPEDARAEFSDWIPAAQSRNDALEAVETFDAETSEEG